jgi:hypothetical protein
VEVDRGGEVPGPEGVAPASVVAPRRRDLARGVRREPPRALEHRVRDQQQPWACPHQLEGVVVRVGDDQLGEAVRQFACWRQQPGDQRDPAFAHPQARRRTTELRPPQVAVQHVAGDLRVVVSRLEQPGLREAVQRPHHAGRPEVDAVDDGGRLAVGVERMDRPPGPLVHRVLGFARDRPDLRLDLGRSPVRVHQGLVRAGVEQYPAITRPRARRSSTWPLRAPPTPARVR